MQIIPSSRLAGHDKASLRAFLEGCRDTALAKDRFQIASISLAVRHIAPLAVLQSIYEPEELHFYVERASDEMSVAGAEAVAEARFEGPHRFAQAKAFAADILENTVAVGDLDAAFTGPHFFTAFTFAPQAPDTSVFPAATVFVPRWQVSRSGGGYGAVANVRVEPDADLEGLVERVWGAYQKFSAFDYGAEDTSRSQGADPEAIRRSELAPDVFPGAVATALSEIEAGHYEKIVLARGIRLEAGAPWRPLDALNGLRERFGGCFTFSFGGGSGRSFIGATPERLLKVRDGHLQTEAIAGSAARGATAGEDARYGRNLLESEKDLHEHVCVRDSILRRLQGLGLEATADSAPSLLLLPNVQHLRTMIQAELGPSAHILDAVAELHPTPAVGGTPREAAVERIEPLEQLDRGLYAGVVGWFNYLNEGEMVVGIRSALIDGCEARLYAGAGIVKGSDPEQEKHETTLKLSALLNVLTS
ncbi:MAG: isochorismate synthase MenF [Opitutales bacterium]